LSYDKKAPLCREVLSLLKGFAINQVRGLTLTNVPNLRKILQTKDKGILNCLY
jgi:hypothetical protein